MRVGRRESPTPTPTRSPPEAEAPPSAADEPHDQALPGLRCCLQRVVEVAARGLIQARVHGSHDRRSHKTDTQKESTSNECALAYNRVTVAEASPKPEPVPWFQTRASSRYKHTGRLYPMCIFCLGMCKGGRLVFPGVP